MSKLDFVAEYGSHALQVELLQLNLISAPDTPTPESEIVRLRVGVSSFVGLPEAFVIVPVGPVSS